MAICKWCGKEFQKRYNNQVCCCKECQDKRNQEASARSSLKHYYRHKTGNVSTKALVTLGSKGTSCSTKPKETPEEEEKWIQAEAKRIGLDIKKFERINYVAV